MESGSSPSPVYQDIVGDVAVDYINNSKALIVQINNCVAVKTHLYSMGWWLAKHLPYSDPYSSRKPGAYPNLAHPDSRPLLPSVELRTPSEGVEGPTVACCFAQYRMGKCDSTYYENGRFTDPDYIEKSHTADSYLSRLQYFEACLKMLVIKIQNGELGHIDTIIFPKYIGSGGAGGKWFDYRQIITEFATYVTSNNPNINVYVVFKKNELCK